jgi:hypothetical protein
MVRSVIQAVGETKAKNGVLRVSTWRLSMVRYTGGECQWRLAKRAMWMKHVALCEVDETFVAI